MADDEAVENEEPEKTKAVEPVREVKSDHAIVVEEPLAPPKYEVRPLLGDKFQAEKVRDIILSSMQEQLSGRAYRTDQVPRWVQSIANAVRTRVQRLNMKRYKIIVWVQLLEMKGAGVKCAQRCIWDPETDDWADSLYRNDTMFCYTIVYGVYMY